MTPAGVTTRVSRRTRCAMPLGTPVMVKLGPLGAVVSRSSSLASWGVVELVGGRAHARGVAGGVEPAVVAVEDEDLAGRLVVTPAHEAGFPEQEGPGFSAVKAHAGVVLRVEIGRAP